MNEEQENLPYNLQKGMYEADHNKLYTRDKSLITDEDIKNLIIDLNLSPNMYEFFDTPSCKPIIPLPNFSQGNLKTYLDSMKEAEEQKKKW